MIIQITKVNQLTMMFLLLGIDATDSLIGLHPLVLTEGVVLLSYFSSFSFFVFVMKRKDRENHHDREDITPHEPLQLQRIVEGTIQTAWRSRRTAVQWAYDLSQKVIDYPLKNEELSKQLSGNSPTKALSLIL